MRRVLALAAATWLAFPAPARSWPAGEGLPAPGVAGAGVPPPEPIGSGLPAPPQQMFEAMLLYAEQGEFDKAGRVLEKMAPLLDEIKSAYGTDLAEEARKALENGGAWEFQAAVLKIVFHHMKLELSRALKARSRASVVGVRVAYLDYLFLAPGLKRKDPELAAEAERRFKSVYELVVSSPMGPWNEDGAQAHVREIERLCLLALEKG